MSTREREAFEKAFTGCAGRRDEPGTGYACIECDAGWEAWQKRAALAAEPEGSEFDCPVELPDGRIAMLRAWDVQGDDKYGRLPQLPAAATPAQGAAPDAYLFTLRKERTHALVQYASVDANERHDDTTDAEWAGRKVEPLYRGAAPAVQPSDGRSRAISALVSKGWRWSPTEHGLHEFGTVNWLSYEALDTIVNAVLAAPSADQRSGEQE